MQPTLLMPPSKPPIFAPVRQTYLLNLKPRKKLLLASKASLRGKVFASSFMVTTDGLAQGVNLYTRVLMQRTEDAWVS